MFFLKLLILALPVATLTSFYPTLLFIPQFTLVKLVGGLALLATLVHFGRHGIRENRYLTTQTTLFAAFFLYTVLNGFFQPSSFTREILSSYTSILLLGVIVITFVNSSHKIFETMRWICYGICIAAVASLIRTLSNGNMYQRGASLALDANYLGVMLVFGIAVAFYLITLEISPARKLLASLFLVIYGAALMCTLSRGALLGFFVALSVIFITSSNRLKRAVPFVLFVVIISLILPKPYIERLKGAFTPVDVSHNDVLSESALSTIRRHHLFTGGIRMFQEYPLLGVGPGNFYWKIPEYSPVYAGRAHNMYLEILCEEGLIGLVLFISILWCTIRSLLHILKEHMYVQDQRLVIYSKFLLAGLAGFLVCALFLHLQTDKFLWLFVFLTASVGNVYHEAQAATSQHSRETSLNPRSESRLYPLRRIRKGC